MHLASLLAPMTIAQFQTSWNRQALSFSGRHDRFTDIAFDFDQLWRALHMTHTLVNAQFFDAAGRHREMAIAPTHMSDCFAAGMTICMPGIEAFLPALAAQCRALKRSIELAGTMSFSCYWSPEQAGFGLHYDSHPVWIMQVRGKKHWWYSEAPAIEAPRANLVYAPAKLARLAEAGLAIAEPVGLREVVLEPGDMLYLPAGTWHKTRAVDGSSLALTLRSLKGAPDHVAHHLLQTWMSKSPRWRQPLPVTERADRAGAGMAPDTERVLAERLAALQAYVAGLTVDDLARSWAELGSSWVEDRPAGSHRLTPDSRLAVCDHVALVRARDDHGEPCLFVYDGQSEAALRRQAHACLQGRVGHDQRDHRGVHGVPARLVLHTPTPFAPGPPPEGELPHAETGMRAIASDRAWGGSSGSRWRPRTIANYGLATTDQLCMSSFSSKWISS